MKSVKNLVFAVLLLAVLALNALAGDVQTPGLVAQPSPSPTNIMSTDGGIVTACLGDPNSETSGETVETSDYLFFEALLALLSVY